MWRPESVYDPAGHLDEGVVHAWLDGALADESAREVEAHATSCTECAARVAEARGMIAGAARVLGALDGDTSAVRRPPSAAPALARQIRTARAVAAEGRRPTANARRIGLAAAAVFVFAAGTVVLRDELGDGFGVREAIVSDQATGTASAPEQDFATAPQMAPAPLTGAETPAAADASQADNSSSGTATMQRSPSPQASTEGRGAGTIAPMPPMAAAPSAASSPASPVPAPSPAAPAQVGNLASDMSPQAARGEGGMGKRAVATGATGTASAPSAALVPQRIEGGELLVAPISRHPDAWVVGCWRVAGSDTLLQFDRDGLAARAHVPAGGWHGAIRISPTSRSVVEWRLDADSTGPARVRHWDASRDLLLWPGRDSLEAAVVPNADRRGPALTERDRIAREARRRNRSAAHERQFTLIRQPDRACVP